MISTLTLAYILGNPQVESVISSTTTIEVEAIANRNIFVRECLQSASGPPKRSSLDQVVFVLEQVEEGTEEAEENSLHKFRDVSTHTDIRLEGKGDLVHLPQAQQSQLIYRPSHLRPWRRLRRRGSTLRRRSELA